MLSGREAFYAEWRARVQHAVERGPVLDVGTPRPFHKDLSWLRPVCAEPYFTADIQLTTDITFAADARMLPVRDESIGAVICQHVLNYVVDPQHAVDELWRVLRPGGQAYASLSAIAPYTGGYATSPDVVRFTPASGHALFARFRDVDVLPAGGVAQAAWNYLPRRMQRTSLQRFVNTLDSHCHTNASMGFYVFATK